MASPPKLPAARRGPPPLPPGRGGPPPLPNRAIPLLPRNREIPIHEPLAIDRYRTGAREGDLTLSSRDVARASGRTYGVWIGVESTWLNRIRFEPDYDLDGKLVGTGRIIIEFIDLSMFEYPNRQTSEWMDLLESSSKGRYAVYQIKQGHWPYVKLRGPQRGARDVAALAAARQPRTARHAKRTYTVGGKRNAYGKGGVRVV